MANRPPSSSEEDPLRSEGGPVPDAAPVRRHSRRLEDKLLIAFHHACDVADLEVARTVLHIVETMLNRRPSQPDPNRRRNIEAFVAAHERLWHLRHREN